MVFHGLIVECSGLKALSSEGVYRGAKALPPKNNGNGEIQGSGSAFGQGRLFHCGGKSAAFGREDVCGWGCGM